MSEPLPSALRQEGPQQELGLNVDMIDVDSLREWARSLLVHGADVTYWTSATRLASQMQILASQIEKEIRDVGKLRAAVSASRTAQAPQQEGVDLAARVQSYLGHGGLFNPELMDHDKVRGLVMDLQARIQVLETSVDYLRYLVDHPVTQGGMGVHRPVLNGNNRSILVDRDADMRREMRAYLDTLTIQGDNIGEIRRSLFMPFNSQWNGWVRDDTAEREISVPPPVAPAEGEQ